MECIVVGGYRVCAARHSRLTHMRDSADGGGEDASVLVVSGDTDLSQDCSHERPHRDYAPTT